LANVFVHLLAKTKTWICFVSKAGVCLEACRVEKTPFLQFQCLGKCLISGESASTEEGLCGGQNVDVRTYQKLAPLAGPNYFVPAMLAQALEASS
jgi:hypothetical protein